MLRHLRKLFVLLAFLTCLPALAQDLEADPNANFSFPPPVYLLRGEVLLRGTANLPNMESYFIEFRQLNPDLSQDEERRWLPATLPNTQRIVNGELGTWNTQATPDGLYELRMTINVRSGDPVFVLLSPLRVENNIPPFIITATPRPIATLVPRSPTPIPTLPPSPTPIDLTPRVEATVNANVRTGDALVYPIIDNLLAGRQAPIIGISTTGSGWYNILLPTGRTGWISPTIVRVFGDLRSVPRVPPPPPPPPTATPFPTATPAAANLVIEQITLTPDPPRCDETYTLTLRVRNTGTAASGNSASVTAQDVHPPSGTVAASTVGAIPPLNAGESFDVIMRLTVDVFYNETHRITVVIDSSNQVPESNEADNTGQREYTLAQAGCA